MAWFIHLKSSPLGHLSSFSEKFLIYERKSVKQMNLKILYSDAVRTSRRRVFFTHWSGFETFYACFFFKVPWVSAAVGLIR